jgi:hypothetical protein
MFRAMGDRYAEAQTLGNLGIAMEAAQGHRAARACWSEAVEILADLDTDEANKKRAWLDGSEQPKPWWSDWGI